jgi:general secretion pathway protein H
VELVVALAVAGFALSVVPLAVERLFDGAQYRATVRNILSVARMARTEALTSGHETAFSIDLESRRYGVGEKLDHVLPEDLNVELFLAQDGMEQRSQGVIRFYPDGGSSGGSVVLTRRDGTGVQLRVSWLFGRVSHKPI